MLVHQDPLAQLGPQDTPVQLEQLAHLVLQEGAEIRESVEWKDRREGRVNEVILDPPDDGERGEFLALPVLRETRDSLVLRVLRVILVLLVQLALVGPLVYLVQMEREVNKAPPVPQEVMVSLESMAPPVLLDNRDLTAEKEARDIQE